MAKSCIVSLFEPLFAAAAYGRKSKVQRERFANYFHASFAEKLRKQVYSERRNGKNVRHVCEPENEADEDRPFGNNW